MAKTKKTDPFIAKMDKFANDLIDEAASVNVKGEDGAEVPPAASLQTRLDVFRQLTAWVVAKNRLSEGDAEGGALDDLRSRLRKPSPPGVRTSGYPGGPSVRAPAAGRGHPDGNGGSALDAIKRAIPNPDAGDDDGAGDGAER